jgi:hypothetical protein
MPKLPPLPGFEDAMAEKTLYEDVAVVEGDPVDVVVCAIRLGRCLRRRDESLQAVVTGG